MDPFFFQTTTFRQHNSELSLIPWSICAESPNGEASLSLQYPFWIRFGLSYRCCFESQERRSACRQFGARKPTSIPRTWCNYILPLKDSSPVFFPSLGSLQPKFYLFFFVMKLSSVAGGIVWFVQTKVCQYERFHTACTF